MSRNEMLQLLNAMERDDWFEIAYNDLLQDPIMSKEDWNMCIVLDKVENRGIEKGIEQERKRTIHSLFANGSTVQEIARCLQLNPQTVTDMLQM